MSTAVATICYKLMCKMNLTILNTEVILLFY
jgi:hypothetical protein